jgi:hypothetical protein
MNNTKTFHRRSRKVDCIQFSKTNAADVIALLPPGSATIFRDTCIMVRLEAARRIFTVNEGDWVAIGEDGLPRHYTNEQLLLKYELKNKPRVLIYVKGGIAEYLSDEGVNVEIYDADNGDSEPGVELSFKDLAISLKIPVRAD